MKRLQAWALLALLILTGCSDSPRYLVGDELRRVDTTGRWQLVNYWAVWCKPCRAEIPELNQLAKASPQLLVLGVNFDQPPVARLQSDRDALAIEFPVLAEGQLKLPRPEVLPTTYVIDPAGRQRAVLRGEQTLESLTKVLAGLGLDIPAH